MSHVTTLRGQLDFVWKTDCGTFYSHVGNSMAVFAMQSLGCDVASLNTVDFSRLIFFQRLVRWLG